MNDASEKYLAQMLEGYEKGIEGVNNYIAETTTALDNDKQQRAEMSSAVEELRELLGLDEEETAPKVAEAQVS